MPSKGFRQGLKEPRAPSRCETEPATEHLWSLVLHQQNKGDKGCFPRCQVRYVRHKQKGSCGSEQKGHAMTHLLSKPEYRFLQVLLKAVAADSKKKKKWVKKELQVDTEASRCSLLMNFAFKWLHHMSFIFYVVGTLLDIAQVCFNKTTRIWHHTTLSDKRFYLMRIFEKPCRLISKDNQESGGHSGAFQCSDLRIEPDCLFGISWCSPWVSAKRTEREKWPENEAAEH